MNDDLDPDLKALFAAEKDQGPPAEVRDRLAGLLGAALIPPVPPPAGAGVAAPIAKGMVTAAKAWTMAGAAFVAGGTAVIVLTSARAPVAPVAAPTVPTTVMTESAAQRRAGPVIPPPEPLVLDAAAAAIPVAPASTDHAAAPAVDAADSISAERALLDDARTAVNAKDPAVALRILDHHARQFPHGRLWEEREALAVDALVQSHDYDQARARAGRLHQRSPNSLFLPMVDAAIGSIP
jgi:hypothetical protein